MSEQRVGRRGGLVYDSTPRPNRNAQIWHEREAGDAFTVIAARHGITPSRVAQIYANQERKRRWLAERLESAPRP